tara:strand:- start:1137 stop:3191 length:2055 start_codon:yes stop_codon:yes gene_type:complete
MYKKNWLLINTAFLMILGVVSSKAETQKSPPVPQGHHLNIYQEKEISLLYKAAANEVIKALKEKPTCVVLLPTGSTPEKMYREIVAHFKKDLSLDLSQAKFFNLDEYVGLPPTHPLSYAYYMEHYFYGPLRALDPKRAPQKENSFILSANVGETPQETLNRFKKNLADAGAIDLAILGVGGAFIFKTLQGKDIIKGGHIGFNEPGTKPTQETHLVTLTSKTRKDTRHRFLSLQALMDQGEIAKQDAAGVPTKALTMGLKEILSSKKVVLLATGEGKERVIREIFKKAANPDFPASYLLKHPSVSWYFDEFAAKSLGVKPWVYAQSSTYFPRHWLKQCAHCLALKKKTDTISLVDFVKEGVPEEVVKAYQSHRFRTISGEKAIIQDFKNGLLSNRDELPQGQTILIMSPHPDDDVISMGATLKKLIERGNTVHVVYAVTGSNAVRGSLADYQKEYGKQNASDPIKAAFDAKAMVREKEARAATKTLGVPSKNLHYFRADYYTRRGIPGVNPFSAADHKRMQVLLVKINPDMIFFAAEDDPHGAHSLASKLIAHSLETLGKYGKLTGVSLWGYRGAWNEWSLDDPDQLTFVSFDESSMKQKIMAIKEHESQLNPLFPGDDSREFYERAKARNRAMASEYYTLIDVTANTPKENETATLNSLSQPKAMPYLEAFKRFKVKDFIHHYR